MLNISPNNRNSHIRNEQYGSLSKVEGKSSGKLLQRTVWIGVTVLLLLLFIPWTQNIRSKGFVTALRPDQRPQTIHSVIAGRIEKWFVQEGQFVKKGDTILYISEIKDEYFDPKLLERTQDQLKSKELAAKSYGEKVKSLDNQIDALLTTSQLKLQQAKIKYKQARLKVTSDSMDYQASKINFNIAEEQFERMEKLYKQGLKSLTELENRKLIMQKAQATMISHEQNLLSSRNEVINAQVELTSIQAQYRDNISKAESEKYSALSNMYDAEMNVTKLQNQYMNYSVRTGFYYITAPQDGYITKAIQTGLGETIKEGDKIISIMPANPNLAVEMYIRPIDLPLIAKEQHVRIQFDGWPAIVFSGWPNTSYGTYGGTVVAIDNFISDNGMYRILVAPDPKDHKWPEALRVGSGTNSMLLLKDVPIWYELWRQINGFPPDFYKETDQYNVKKK
ncbi:MAG: HlyD family secretion protein [Bacteroidota bacterium]|jgi:adhesin transport system membrane fusion protein